MNLRQHGEIGIVVCTVRAIVSEGLAHRLVVIPIRARNNARSAAGNTWPIGAALQMSASCNTMAPIGELEVARFRQGS